MCETEKLLSEKKITIGDYRLVFLCRRVSGFLVIQYLLAYTRSLAHSLRENLQNGGYAYSTEYPRVFYFLSSTVERIGIVFSDSDLIGLEICHRRLDEHTKVLFPLSLAICHLLRQNYSGFSGLFNSAVKEYVRNVECTISREGREARGFPSWYRRKTGIQHN